MNEKFLHKDTIKRMKKNADTIMEKLPHGAGIDTDWGWYWQGNFVYFSNSYHYMNDAGMYDGWQDFSVRFPSAYMIVDGFTEVILKEIADSIQIQFNGWRHPKASDPFFGLKDDLHMDIFWSLRGK